MVRGANWDAYRGLSLVETTSTLLTHIANAWYACSYATTVSTALINCSLTMCNSCSYTCHAKPVGHRRVFLEVGHNFPNAC